MAGGYVCKYVGVEAWGRNTEATICVCEDGGDHLVSTLNPRWYEREDPHKPVLCPCWLECQKFIMQSSGCITCGAEPSLLGRQANYD